MDRGSMKFTSDVSLPKDDKIAMQGKQITAGQLTGLRTQTNANYATKERKRLKSMGSTPKQVDRCRDPGYAYVIPIITQSHGEPRAVPTCLSRQGQEQNTLGKHR